MSFSSTLDVLGNWTAFATSDGATLTTLNNEAQSAAAIAGKLATVNSFAALGAIIAGGVAAETQLSVLKSDQSQKTPNQLAIFGDYAGLVGDLMITAGGIAEAIPTPATQLIGHVVEKLGTVAALIGIGVASGQITSEAQVNAIIENDIGQLQWIMSSISSALTSAGSSLASSFGSYGTTISTALNAVSVLLSAEGTGSFMSDSTAAASAFATTETSTANFLNTAKIAPQTATETATGSTLTVTDSTRSDPTASGTVADNSGGTPDSLTVSSNGVTDGSENNSINSTTGADTETSQVDNASGAAQFTDTTTVSSSGVTTDNVTGDGDTVVLNNATVDLAASAEATVYGTGDAIALNVGDTVSINGTDTISLVGVSNFSATITNGMVTANSGSVTFTPIQSVAGGITLNFASGDSLTLDTGTYSNLSYNSSTNTLTATLMANKLPLGSIVINASGGGTLTLAPGALASGEVFTLPSLSSPHIAAVTAGTSNLQALAGYLTDLGVSLSASQLSADNDTYENQELGPGFTNVRGTTLQAEGDVSAMSISGYQTLSIDVWVLLTAAQLSSFASVTAASYDFPSGGVIDVIGGGTASLANANTVEFFEALSWNGTTLIGNNGFQYLEASQLGADTLEAGNAAADALVAGEGVDTLKGGTGGDYFYALNGLADGSSVQGQGSGNTLIASGDISQATISGVQTLLVGPNGGTAVTLTASELSGFTQIFSSAGIIAATGGTYSLAGIATTGTSNTVTGSAFGPAGSIDAETFNGITLTAGSDAGTTLVGNNDSHQILTASQSGNDTLQAGNGSGDVLNAGGGTDVLTAGTGSDTLNGGLGYASYKFGSSFGQDVINNASGGAYFANGEIDFTSGVTFNKLWFSQSGNNLVIQLIGTSDTITVEGWFGGNAGAQVLAINDANGSSLSNSQVSALVGAMTTYQSNNSSFNPTTATTMPTNSTLQIATAYAWTGTTYSSITVNGNGSWSGVINDTSGSDWTSLTDNYSTSNILTSTVELFNNGSSFTVTYGSNGNNSYSVSGNLPSGAVVGATANNNTVTLGNITGVTIDSYGSIGNNTLTIQDTLANNTGSNWNNTLEANVTSGNNTLTVGDGSYDYLRTDWSTGNNHLTAGNGSHDWLDAENSTGTNILSVGSGTNNTLDVSYSSGNNTLTTLTGSSDYLNVEHTTGQNTLQVGTGSNNTLDTSNSSGANSITVGNGTNNTVNIYNVSGVNTVTINGGTDDYVNGGVGIGANSITDNSGSDNKLDVSWSYGNNTVVTSGTGDWLDAESSKGANSLSDHSGSGNTLDASFSSGANTLTANVGTNDYLNVESSSGNNTLNGGSGSGEQFSALWSTGQNTFNAGTGNTAMYGGEEATAYNFGSVFGQDQIYNGDSGSGQGATATQGAINFTSPSTTDENLWFQQSGNNLVIDLLGTSDQITVEGWFSGTAGTQVSSIHADGLTLDSQVSQLVQAMATYASANSGFNPTSATSMPTNSTLQTAIAAAWHH